MQLKGEYSWILIKSIECKLWYQAEDQILIVILKYTVSSDLV